jgi:hypothetical protein
MPDNYKEMDGKNLYFEMRTHPPDKSVIFLTKGMTRMSASPSYISISWPDFPGADSFKGVTLRAEDAAKIEPNTTGRTFELFGKVLNPDFIYIEHYST